MYPGLPDGPGPDADLRAVQSRADAIGNQYLPALDHGCGQYGESELPLSYDVTSTVAPDRAASTRTADNTDLQHLYRVGIDQPNLSGRVTGGRVLHHDGPQEDEDRVRDRVRDGIKL